MCNPRRVQVTLTRDMAQAWEREVSRSVALSTQVTGEARVRQPLEDTLGSPVRQALEMLLAQESDGWQETEQGYRYDVEGGYVIYDTDHHVLEIVASLQDQVAAEATATRVISGKHQEQLSTTETGQYYDDGWGGRTQTLAEAEARKVAEKALEERERIRLREIAEQAEQDNAESVRGQAEAEARQQLEKLAQQRQGDLSHQARQHLDTVGVQCRQAFNGLLAQAYRDAIMAYARRHGAEGLTCQDDGDTVEIEFFMER